MKSHKVLTTAEKMIGSKKTFLNSFVYSFLNVIESLRVETA